MSDLFPDAPTMARQVQPRAPGERIVRPRLVAETDCWTVEDHVCRLCFGRILSSPGPAGRRYMCADCGHRDEGVDAVSRTGGRMHPAFCACSMRYGSGDAGVRCSVNEAPSPALPSAIIARQVE